MESLLKKLPDPFKVAGVGEILVGLPSILKPDGALKRVFGISDPTQPEMVVAQFFGSAIIALGLISFFVSAKSKDQVAKFWTAVGMLVYNLLLVLFVSKLAIPEVRIFIGIAHLLGTIHFAAYVWVNMGKTLKRS